MFFLLRMTFWLGLVLILLPIERAPQAEKLPQVNVSDAVHAGTAPVSELSEPCKRQLQGCEVGGQAATVIEARTPEAARKIYHSITNKKSDPAKKSPDDTGSIGERNGRDRTFSEAGSRDTLTREDLAVEWRRVP
jgi:hypothetical protein